MVAYVLTANATLRDVGNAGIWGVATARAGGDTVDTNGFSLTVDQDSRYGLGGTTSTTWGSLTVNATKGGAINIDGRFVRMIPFTGGSGTITAGSLITCGSGTGRVIGIYSAITAAPVLTGVATGWIKVTAWNSVAFPTSGAFTQAGYTFTISGPSIVGFIEINGDDAATIVANRLSPVNLLGEWFELGNTSGTSNQTLQIPNNGAARYCPGVFIEATSGAGDFEFYPNAGTTTTTGTEAARGKVVWIDATGLVRIGNSGAATNGYTPTSGRRVVVGNVFFECNTTAARTANVIPNATVATRYDFTSTGGGVIVADKISMNWYLSLSQAYSVTLTNSGFTDAILLSEIAAPMTLTKIGVGNKATTALNAVPLTLTTCFAGGTITDCVFQRAPATGNNATANVITDCSGFTFTRVKMQWAALRGFTLPTSLTATRLSNSTFNNHTEIGAQIALITCTNLTFNNMAYIGGISGTTSATNPCSMFLMTSNCLSIKFDGLTFPVTNNHPYTVLYSIGVAGCSDIKIRNIGTRAAPLSLGSATQTGLIYTLATGAAASNVKVQRVYCSNTRTGIMTGDNSSSGIVEQNVYGDYADAVDVMACLNMTRRGMGGTGALSAQTSVYGTHWRDNFISATVGKIAILMNEPTTSTIDQVTLENGAAFTSAGGLYMPTVGMAATFTMPGLIYGHIQFANVVAVMAGGTIGNYGFRFQIDKNDGAGWQFEPTWESSLMTAAQMQSFLAFGFFAQGNNYASGFKFRLRIETTNANTTAITSLIMETTSSAASQDILYPLETTTLTITCKDAADFSNIAGARVYVTASVGGWLAPDAVILNAISDANGVATITIPLSGTSQPVSGRARKSTSSPLYKTSPISGTITAAGLDVTAFMIKDE